MTVTEFAILPLGSGDMSGDCLAVFRQSQATQDKWVQANQKPAASSHEDQTTGHLTTFLQQIEDPTNLLLTARWGSVGAHHEWIASSENQQAMGSMQAQLDTQAIVAGEKSVTLFHLEDGEMLAQPDGASKTAILSAPVISVGRFLIKSGETKEKFQKIFDGAKWVVEDVSKPYPMKGSWRIEEVEGSSDDPSADRMEEFVMFCGWQSVEQHMSAAQHERWEDWKALLPLVSKADIKHYKVVAM